MTPAAATSFVDEIHRAPTLYALAPIAARMGASEVLELDLVDFPLDVELSDEAIEALQDVLRKGRVRNVGELLAGAHPTMPRWKAPRRVVAELLGAIKGLLIREVLPPLPSWESRAELEIWAARHGLPGLTSLPIHHLPEIPAQTMRLLRAARADSLPIADLIFPDTFGGARLHAALGDAERKDLANAARVFLKFQAESAAETRALAESVRAEWPRPGTAPSVARAGGILLETLRRFGEAAPFVPCALLEDVRCTAIADPPHLSVTMGAPALRAGARAGQLHIRLGLDSSSASCSCSPDGGLCSHVGTAIILVFDTLGDPEHHLTAEVDRIVGKPAWARTLEALDTVLAPPDPPTDRRVVWRVTTGSNGAVALAPLLQTLRARGGWTRGAKLGEWEAREACTGERDERACAALFDGAYYSDPRPVDAVRALFELCGQDNVVLADDGQPPLEVVEAAASLRTVEREGGSFELVIRVGDEVVAPAEVVAALDAQGGRTGMVALIDRKGPVCRVSRIPHRLEAVIRALAKRHTVFPSDAIAPLWERLQGLQQVAPVHLAESLAGREVERSEAYVARLERAGAGVTLAILAKPVVPGAAFEPGAGPALAVGTAEGERIFARRDFDAEHDGAQALCATLPLADAEPIGPHRFRLEGEAALDLLVHLSERPAEPGLTIEWPKDRPRISRSVRASDLRVAVENRRDWFGLSGGVEVDGLSVDIALALDAARRGDRYVQAEPGVFIALADELRDQLARAADQVHEGRGGLELSIAAAPSIEALVQDGAELRAAREFSDLLGRIRASAEWEAELPAGLKAELRPYQLEGFRWLARLAEWGAGGCLADDMGLGKTLQSLALLLHRAAQGPALVVAPTSVCGNWLREAERFAPGLRPVVYGALSDAERKALAPGPGDLVLVSYGLLVREIDRLAGRSFATAIFDEAQALKNPQTARAQAARRIDAPVRFALSGTPLENHLGELWSLFRIVMPGLLGSSERFRERFALPIERGDAGRRRALANVLRPFLLRRSKVEVATDLPPRVEIDVPIELSPAERRLYDEARIAAAARVAGLDGSTPPEKRRFEILAAITRLRLCACHPRLYDDASKLSSAKLTHLVSTVAELRDDGHRSLVFSQFTKHLDLAEAALDASGARCLRLDGSTPAARRQELVDAWQAGEADVFLVSLKAGGTGLNLTTADYVIHLDPWWNPAAEDQATDRAHRIGQTRPVTVLRLISQGTIEEQIVALHGEKRALLASVLDGADGGVRVDSEALLALLEAAPDEESGDEEVEAAVDPEAVPRGADPQALVEELRRYLEDEVAARRIGAGAVNSYLRAMRRFASFAEAGRVEPVRSDTVEAVRDHYLAALRDGRWAAPSSEPLVARAAFGKLAEMLRRR